MEKISLVIIAAWLSIFYPACGFPAQSTVDIHGFLSQGYMVTTRNNYIADSKDGTFQFNEMGINFTTNPTDKLRMGMQFFARDFGTVGNDEIVVDWALADYRFKDWLGFRAGKLKNPMGLYNETRDIDMLRTTILLPVSPYDEPYRETAIAVQGFGMYGDINSDWLGSLNYQLLTGSINISNDGGTADYTSQGRFDMTALDIKKIYSGSLIYSDPSGCLRAGATFYFTDLDVEAVSTAALIYEGISFPGFATYFEVYNVEAYVLSLELTLGRLILAGEYFWGHTSLNANVGGVTVPVDPYDPLGMYGAFSYRVTEALELGYFRMVYYSNEKDRDGSQAINKNEDFPVPDFKSWQTEDVVSLRFDINDNWLVKLETHYIDGAAKVNYIYNPDTARRYWWMHLAKVSFKF